MIYKQLPVCLVLVLAIGSGTSYVFDTVKPMLYIPTPNYVVTGTVKYSITFKFINPCQMLPNESVFVTHDNNSNIDKMIFKKMRTMCDILYTETWMKKVKRIDDLGEMKPAKYEDQLSSYPAKTRAFAQTEETLERLLESPSTSTTTESPSFAHVMQDFGHHYGRIQHLRRKRDLSGLKDAAIGFVGGIFGSAVSNLINTFYERIDPGSTYNRVGRAEQTLETYGKALRAIKGVTGDLLNSVETFARELAAVKRDVQILADVLPQIVFGSQRMNQAINQATDQLEAVYSMHLNKNNVDLTNLARLLNTTIFAKKHDPSDTHFTKIELLKDDTILFEFEGLEKSQDSHILRLDPFDYWDNLTEITAIKRSYKGAEYVIYNETANCIKHIEKPRSVRVIDDCFVKNFDDGYADDWEIIEKTNNLQSIKKIAQVKASNYYNYIYCFPWDITIEGNTYRCPAKPFRLSLNTAFQTANKKHQSSEKVIKLIKSFDTEGFEAIHHAHLEEESDLNNELQMIEQLRELKIKIGKVDLEKRELITVAYYSPAFWTIICLLVASLLTLATCAYFWFKQRFGKRKVKHTRLPLKDIVPKRRISQDSRAQLNEDYVEGSRASTLPPEVYPLEADNAPFVVYNVQKEKIKFNTQQPSTSRQE